MSDSPNCQDASWPTWADALLTEIAKCGVVSVACDRLNLPRRTVSYHTKRNASLRKAVHSAKGKAIDLVKSEVVKRSRRGWKETTTVHDRNGLVSRTVKDRWNPSLAVRLLETYDPAWKRKEPTVQVNVALVTQETRQRALTDPESLRLAAMLDARLAAPPSIEVKAISHTTDKPKPTE